MFQYYSENEAAIPHSFRWSGEDLDFIVTTLTEDLPESFRQKMKTHYLMNYKQLNEDHYHASAFLYETMILPTTSGSHFKGKTMEGEFHIPSLPYVTAQNTSGAIVRARLEAARQTSHLINMKKIRSNYDFHSTIDDNEVTEIDDVDRCDSYAAISSSVDERKKKKSEEKNQRGLSRYNQSMLVESLDRILQPTAAWSWVNADGSVGPDPLADFMRDITEHSRLGAALSYLDRHRHNILNERAEKNGFVLDEAICTSETDCIDDTDEEDHFTSQVGEFSHVRPQHHVKRIVTMEPSEFFGMVMNGTSDMDNKITCEFLVNGEAWFNKMVTMESAVKYLRRVDASTSHNIDVPQGPKHTSNPMIDMSQPLFKSNSRLTPTNPFFTSSYPASLLENIRLGGGYGSFALLTLIADIHCGVLTYIDYAKHQAQQSERRSRKRKSTSINLSQTKKKRKKQYNASSEASDSIKQTIKEVEDENRKEINVRDQTDDNQSQILNTNSTSDQPDPSLPVVTSLPSEQEETTKWLPRRTRTPSLKVLTGTFPDEFPKRRKYKYRPTHEQHSLNAVTHLSHKQGIEVDAPSSDQKKRKRVPKNSVSGKVKKTTNKSHSNKLKNLAAKKNIAHHPPHESDDSSSLVSLSSDEFSENNKD